MPVVALVDECPAYDLEPAEPADAAVPGAAGGADRRRPGRDPARRCSARPTSPRASGRSSSTTAIVGSRTVRRPEAADAAVLLLPERPATALDRRSTRRSNGDGAAARDRGRDRRQRPPRRRRPLPRRGRGRRSSARANLACVGAEPLGPDQLPELRQPREAAHRLAAHPRDRRPRRRLPRVRHPGRGRQRLALQRGRRGPDLPDAGRRPGRRAARRARAPAGSASRTPGDAIALVTAGLGAVAAPPPSCPSCAARPSRARCPRADLGELKALHAAIRQAVRAGALHSAHDVAEGGVAVALAECRLACGLGATVARPATEDELFGEGPGAFVVSGPAAALTAFGAAARVIGEVGGDAVTIEGVAQRPARRARPRPHGRPRRPAALDGYPVTQAGAFS